jgi:CysZ protein
MIVDIFIAFARSLGTFMRPRVWFYLLAPAVVSFLLWSVLAMWELESAVSWLVGVPPLSWLAAAVPWLAQFIAFITVWLGILALTYVTAMLITAIFILPLLIKHVAERDYPDVALMGTDNFTASTRNSVIAALLFVGGWIATMPLWLIPGLGLVLPVFWLAWLNRRTFAYDALAVHANDWESETIRRENGFAYLLMGFLLALLAHVPIFGLLVPTFAALAYVHFSLEALRQFRGGEVVTITGNDQ